MYCKNCGREVSNEAYTCPSCGNPLKGHMAHKRQLVPAAILALMFGTLGADEFYLGYSGKGYARLLITTLGACFFGIGPLVSLLWSLYSAITILEGRKLDADGNQLV